MVITQDNSLTSSSSSRGIDGLCISQIFEFHPHYLRIWPQLRSLSILFPSFFRFCMLVCVLCFQSFVAVLPTALAREGEEKWGHGGLPLGLCGCCVLQLLLLLLLLQCRGGTAEERQPRTPWLASPLRYYRSKNSWVGWLFLGVYCCRFSFGLLNCVRIFVGWLHVVSVGMRSAACVRNWRFPSFWEFCSLMNWCLWIMVCFFIPPRSFLFCMVFWFIFMVSDGYFFALLVVKEWPEFANCFLIEVSGIDWKFIGFAEDPRTLCREFTSFQVSPLWNVTGFGMLKVAKFSQRYVLLRNYAGSFYRQAGSGSAVSL